MRRPPPASRCRGRRSASPASTARSVRERRPAATSSWLTRPAARMDGIATRRRTRRPIGHHDELHAPSRRGARLPGEPRQPEREPARPARDRPGRIQDRRRGSRMPSSWPQPSWSRIGESMTTAAGSGAPRKSGCRPTAMASDITARSRSGSIGGLVTWANDWRRNAETRRGRRASGAIGVSSPMLQIASWPSVAIGRISCLTISASRPMRNAQPIVAGRRLPDRDAGDQATRHGPRRRAVALDGRPDHPAGRDVDHHHLAGAQPAPMRHPLRGELNAPRLGRDDHQPVVGRRQRQGPKPVAVEHRSDPSTVAEHERGRAVPRLRARLGRVQRRAAEPFGRRDQRADGRVDPHPAQQQQLERVVQRLRVGADLGHQRADLGKPLGPSASAKRMASSAHRFAVRADGVDLAVVRQVPERLRQPPRGERVRRVALMERRRSARRGHRPGDPRRSARAHRRRRGPCRPPGDEPMRRPRAAAGHPCLHASRRRMASATREGERRRAGGRRPRSPAGSSASRPRCGRPPDRAATGTSRQPATVRPSAAARSSTNPAAASASAAGRKHIATATRPRGRAVEAGLGDEPRAESRRDRESRCRRRRRCVSSAARAPRWARAASASSAIGTVRCAWRPSRSATKPTPQASCSCRGS